MTDELDDEWQVTDAGVLIPATCQSCGETFPLKLSHSFAAKLQAAGITGEEVGKTILAGIRSGRILCNDCLQAKTN